jgi:hypothetical protein
MKYGFILPGGSAVEQVELAVLAEQSGWDGVFVWEAAYGIDAWSVLAAMAVRTTRIRLGTLLTPLPWRRPWKLAGQVATVDQLSAGRVIVSVGLGAVGSDLPDTGEPVERRQRAEMLDEGIDLIRVLWSGGTSFHGSYYDYECGRDEQTTVARPVQDRIPIWVVAAWPRPRSMQRTLRCDGIIGVTADPVAARQWVIEHGGPADIDIIVEGETPADDPATAHTMVTSWAERDCTWWMETRWDMPHHSAERIQQARQRITAGPPTKADHRHKDLSQEGILHRSSRNGNCAGGSDCGRGPIRRCRAQLGPMPLT